MHGWVWDVPSSLCIVIGEGVKAPRSEARGRSPLKGCCGAVIE
jgi:hypothetical protein